LSRALNGTASQSYGMSPLGITQCYLPPNTHALTPARGRYSIYLLGGMEG